MMAGKRMFDRGLDIGFRRLMVNKKAQRRALFESHWSDRIRRELDRELKWDKGFELSEEEKKKFNEDFERIMKESGGDYIVRFDPCQVKPLTESKQ